MTPLLRLLSGTLALLFITAASATAALAHPLGNFTSNTYAGLVLDGEGLSVDYVLDLAELPTVQAKPDYDVDGDGEMSTAEGDRYAASRCGELASGLDVSVAGDAVALTVGSAMAELLPGTAGLQTLRVECVLASDIVLADGDSVTLVDTNVRDRVGWHEVTASGPRVGASDVSAGSSSDRLRAYPEGVAPLDVSRAQVTVGAGGGDPLAGLAPTGGIEALEDASSRLTDLIARQELTAGFVILAIAIATALGATHSLAPGHGKTVMAAYLVSREGTLRQMFGLGATVAVTHTLGVMVLGILVTSATALAPERLYPYLGMLSGALFAAVGVWLLLRARRDGHHEHPHHDHPHHDAATGASEPHEHDRVHAVATAHAASTAAHPHPADDHHHGLDGHHGHDGHTHDHEHHGAHDHTEHGHRHPELEAAARGELGWRTLVLPGLAGGMLPSPSALVVLVAGIALGRFTFGLTLVLFYGVGMAITLMAAGWLLVKMRHRVVGRLAASDRWGSLTSRLPTVTASLVVLGGAFIVARSALTI